MTVLNDKARRDLEYDRLKALVRDRASTSLGAAAIDELEPIDDRLAIERSIGEVGEAVSLLDAGGRVSLGGVRDLGPLLRRARESAFLDGEEFLVVLHTIEATEELRRRLIDDEDRPRLRGYAERLSPAGPRLAAEIGRVIDESGAVRDDASPELSRLIQRRRVAEQRAEAKLRAFIDSHPDWIGEPVITQRRGRLVVPVRSGATGAGEFVVHDRSATGQTLYAEPTGLVVENNVIAELAEAIREETRRILVSLTERFVASESTVLRDRAILAHLDSLFARALYADAHRCSFPQLGDRFALRNARHPLLPRETVVPVTLSVGGDRRMVVITGPNTGGKTVTIKTLGLSAAMVQSGIPIPASPDSELAIVSRIRTDIGDEQSIAQNLSTFSAHMKNIIDALHEADEGTLVLFDELGAGTDPQEGAALGLAVIEALLERGPIVAISTHLTPLKYFAIRHPRIKTASMEFDLATLAPTFHVVEGLPGKSNAFIIALRLGFPEPLIERARAFLTQGEIRAEDIIEELQRERQALVEHREEARADRERAAELRATYEHRLRAFEQEKERDLSAHLRELDAFLRDGQRQVEDVLAAARSGAPVEGLREGLHEIARLRDGARAARDEMLKPRSDETIDETGLEPGRSVRVRSLDAVGRIVHLASGGRVSVDLDGIRVTVEIDDLSPADPPVEPARGAGDRGGRSVRRPRPSEVPLQIDVRGLTVSEALRELEGYLDQLLLADLQNARILHGKGTGALRQAIHTYLSSCSFVRSCRFAPPNQGGDGVTEIELGTGN